ncbi:MAG: hypothetical protein RL582_1950, partial [Bacteroidota bacterium]
MRQYFLLAFMLVSGICSQAQNLSFTCPRDTVLGCNTSCFNFKALIPDIKSQACDYTLEDVTRVSACRPYDPPDIPGPSAGLSIDDRYSDTITLPFTFPFYCTNYNKLIVSTNGYLSFDITQAQLFADWSLANGNVPNALYDKALIMGPWHDLDPSVQNSPTRQVKVQEVGTAPTRKWVLSFYKLPLFSATCNPLIENTHQIVLHESTGIIEVFIQDKQICPSWNDGRAMVGLQDETRTKGIMAPGRRATDPSWGTIGMNEVWRFYPSNGPTTFRSVELLDASGAVIANGTNDTTRVDSNTWEVGFNNICAPTGTSLFVVKTKYLSITNPTDTIYSLDTINVTRQAALPIDAVIVPTNCGTSVGSITVNASGTGPYIYSIDGGATQTSNVFTGLSAGPHTIFAQDVNNCQNTITATVTAVSSLPSNITFTNCTCPSVNDGTATANPLLGTAPFTFTINGSGTLPGPNSTGIFTGLAPGTYTISFTDAQNCAGTTTAVTIGAGAAITSTSTSTGTCPGLSNGSITVTPTSGTGPYNFDLPGYTGTPPAPGPSGTFTGLASNGLPYNVIITDANGCSGTRNVTVNQTAGISSTTSSTAASCVGVSDGSITITPTSGSGPYTFSIDGAAAVPSPTPPSITFTDLTGGPHTIVVTDASGCTG